MPETTAVQSSSLQAYNSLEALERNRQRQEESRDKENAPPVNSPAPSTNVTISTEARRRLQLESGADNEPTAAQQASQSENRTQQERPEQARAAAATTVAQQINAYLGTQSIIR